MAKEPRFHPPYIRQWRQAKGMSLEQVALGVPMDKGNLSKVERGLLPYNQEMLERLGDILGTEPGNLISRDPTKEGKVIDLVQRLSENELVQAERVLSAMFKAG
jgi:transcriptional regulator with XRE-family HTH domain